MSKDQQKIERIKKILAENSNPSDMNSAMYLLISEVRSMNSRISYTLGALGVLIILMVAQWVQHSL